MAVQPELLLNARLVQSTAVDNAIATVTIAAVPNIRHFISGIDADYSVTLGAGVIKTITLKVSGVAIAVWRWDYSKGPFSRNFPVPLHSGYNEAVTVEIEASGTGGQTGRGSVWVSDL